eukprot:scaffold7266_cov17-Tisochrysis_lutea.AAC.1
MLVGECTCAQQRNVRVYAPKRGQNDQRTDEMSGLIVHALLKFACWCLWSLASKQGTVHILLLDII